jgi:hypothetical protein
MSRSSLATPTLRSASRCRASPETSQTGAWAFGMSRAEHWHLAPKCACRPLGALCCSNPLLLKRGVCAWRRRYGEELDRHDACKNASVVIMITDSCPCVKQGNEYSNKRCVCALRPAALNKPHVCLPNTPPSCPALVCAQVVLRRHEVGACLGEVAAQRGTQGPSKLGGCSCACGQTFSQTFAFYRRTPSSTGTWI